MLKHNILITGTGGCGVGEGLYKSLHDLKEYDLYSCNSSDNSLFLFKEIKNSFIVPKAGADNYSEIVLKICNEYNIKIVIPGSEPELVTLVNNRQLFEEQGVIICANSKEVINTFDNKWETFNRLNSFNIKTPDSTLSPNDGAFFERNIFPLIVKPIIGNASKNVFLVRTQEELDCICTYLSLKNIPIIIQEYIGTAEEEYTISVLSDFSGNYLGSIVLKRVLANGFSQFIECERFEKLDLVAQNIALKVASKGPLNIQCRIMNDELYIFEINPRFSGTTPFRTLLGFNEANILLKKVLNGQNAFNKNNIKYGSFGVRGFIEEVYSNDVKNKVKKYK
ncbi:MAG: hypothetical protein JWR02_14 [Mucilaginibacter sp.]|nr:hypothetical protein [Mucilaginibacter sp.]